MDKLTPKQKAFADYYLECGIAEEAAIKAGYSKAYARGNAHKLVANSCISKYLKVRQILADEKKIAKADEVLEFYTSVLRGEVKGQFDLDASLDSRLKAADSLAKRYGLFKEKREISVSDKAKDELSELLEQRRKRVDSNASE